MSNPKSSETSVFYKKKPLFDFAKRVCDLVLSVAAAVLLIPVFLIIAVIIKLTSKGPVFFVHKRVGKNGKEIGIIKFRSMVVNAEELIKKFTPEQKREFEENFKLDDDPRVTKIGKFLRKTSLDELPQLINIIKGDLSIIGPRPVTKAEVEMYGRHKAALLSVKPGLTGFWAANGRSNTSYNRRMAMELYYVKYRSICLDIKILFKTVLSVFKGEGAK